MSQLSLQPQPQRKVDALVLSADQLRQALAASPSGRERQWAEAVGDALAHVETALRAHRANANAPDGILAEVDETRPTLARQADELRSEHDVFLAQVVALREEVQRAAEAFRPTSYQSPTSGGAEIADFGAIRQHAEECLAGLQKNSKAETQLVMESVNTDIGTGD